MSEKPSKAELKELKRRYAGKPVGGDPSEVVSIGFLLDIGAIDGELDGAARIEVLRRLWGRFNFDGNASVDFSKAAAPMRTSFCPLRKAVRRSDFGSAVHRILSAGFTMYAICCAR